MSQPKIPGVRPIFRLNGERKSWDTLYNCTEPSCLDLDECSRAFWWLREREPWRRISAEIAAQTTMAVVLQSAEVAAHVRKTFSRTSRKRRETCH
jgi:hypothetical protein